MEVWFSLDCLQQHTSFFIMLVLALVLVKVFVLSEIASNITLLLLTSSNSSNFNYSLLTKISQNRRLLHPRRLSLLQRTQQITIPRPLDKIRILLVRIPKRRETPLCGHIDTLLLF